MLLCPKCQFENPNTNKFCQKCGTSLTHKTCQECHAQVQLNAETCDNCGTFTGTVWWAIISKDLDAYNPTMGLKVSPLDDSENQVPTTAQTEEPLTQAEEESSPTLVPPLSAASSPSLVEDNPKADVEEISAPAIIEASLNEGVTQPQLSSPQTKLSPIPNENNSKSEDSNLAPKPAILYLDSQQRYRLLEPLSWETYSALKETVYGAQLPVLDCQPFQTSLLEALKSQKQDEYDRTDGATKAPTNVTLSNNQALTTQPSDSWKLLSIPAIAQPYLALQESCYPTLPAIHDAWQQDGEVVLLVEDRSHWQPLSELWDSEELPSLQVIYWLDEMAKLWQALEPWHCRHSLLEISNLRVDEDQSLGLVRLYPEKTEVPATLQDLGQTWQKLFDQSKRTQFTHLAAIFQQLSTKEIQTIDHLRSQLQQLVHEQDHSYQPDVTENNLIDHLIDQEMPTSEDVDYPTVILPMQLLSLDDAGCTDIGQQREKNEDCFGIETQVKKQENPKGRSVQARGLYILCDGMGGHAGGEVASAMAVEKIKTYFQEHWQDKLPTQETVREAVNVANQAIYDVNQENSRSGNGRMGTTLAMILIQNTESVIAHVGDSRIYRLTRKRGLEQLTVDHEVGQREIKRGVEPEIAYDRPDAYQLTQALGPRNEQFINPDLHFLELNEDTLFLLCSDGLSDNDLIETYWQTHLAPLLSARANLDQGIVQLIDLANEHNGYDNITAILIRVKVRPNFQQQQLL